MFHKIISCKQKQNRNFSTGFTLIELLVVIAIIGIMANIVLTSLNTARQKGRDAKRESDLHQIRLSLELFYDDKKYYPTDIYLPSPDGLAPAYLPVMPTDPLGGSNYGYERNNPATGKYCIGTILEVGSPNTDVCTLSGLCTDSTGNPADCNFTQTL